MIVYDGFWLTLKKSGQSTYTLITKHHISSSVFDKYIQEKIITTLFS